MSVTPSDDDVYKMHNTGPSTEQEVKKCSKHILLTVLEPRVRNRGVSPGRAALPLALGEGPSVALAAPGGSWRSLARGHIIPVSASVFTRRRLLCLSSVCLL